MPVDHEFVEIPDTKTSTSGAAEAAAVKIKATAIVGRRNSGGRYGRSLPVRYLIGRYDRSSYPMKAGLYGRLVLGAVGLRVRATGAVLHAWAQQRRAAGGDTTDGGITERERDPG